MRAVPKFLAAVLFLSALGCAQTAPYADAGIGVNGLGFQSPYYDADVGIDWGEHRPTFFEAEVGADTANPNGLNNGTTFRAEGIVMWRSTPHWRLGGGIHFSDLFASKYGQDHVWPTLGALFERDWFRLNAQLLIPTSPTALVGPLFDMRIAPEKQDSTYANELEFIGTSPILSRVPVALARSQTSASCTYSVERCTRANAPAPHKLVG